LRQVIDDVLQGDTPAAHWAFLADRALPAEAGMKSVRLLHKRDGRRQVLLAARNHERMAMLVRPVFSKAGLTLSSEELRRLLEEGVNLVGAGLLDLIREDGQPDRGRVVGLAGMLIAARDYRQRHPNALLVAVDNEVAKLWLRLGRDPNRCDLLALRPAGGEFIIEAVEVKTTEREEGTTQARTALRHAQEQIAAVLNAISAAVPDNTTGANPLSAPRCEMLKEVLVRGCQSRAAVAARRAEWSSWLKQVFRQEAEAPRIRCQGEALLVLLGSSHDSGDEVLAASPYSIRARMLGVERVEELIREGVQSPSREGDGSTGRSARPEPKPYTPPKPVVPPNASPGRQPEPREDQPAFVRAVPTPASSEDVHASMTWPPPVNALGMIGQAEVVAELVRQMNYARARNRRFSDKLLVGPAGVGKSSLARAIARKLLGDEEVLFNGADLKTPSALITRLRERKKVPARPKGRVKVEPCLVFIDEVHAISNAVQTTLLSAMDDERIAPIEDVVFDFGQVVFILATTDPGKLSEAFNSRPDKTYLRSYTLDEMAGIIWLHGKENLNKHELPREVCIEVAARMRCNPRRAVRCLTERLLPFFHSETHDPDEKLDVKRLARSVILEKVRSYFEEQGIDLNGLDVIARNYLQYLARNGATPEDRLRQGLGISNKGDFLEVDEYVSQRLGLVQISSAGRTLTAAGRKYLGSPADLRAHISRHR
jgi:Holliday junction resolvasome RuvABC ATP-dependent DNA helicase subunit